MFSINQLIGLISNKLIKITNQLIIELKYQFKKIGIIMNKKKSSNEKTNTNESS